MAWAWGKRAAMSCWLVDECHFSGRLGGEDLDEMNVGEISLRPATYLRQALGAQGVDVGLAGGRGDGGGGGEEEGVGEELHGRDS